MNPILAHIKETSKIVDVDLSQSCLLRECFDMASSEWDRSTIDEKVDALQQLVKNDGENTLKLAMGMLDYCNREAGKDIKLLELVISLSTMMDNLLKRP